jgi:predicted regulator of Ras-like GTPase activity (Roadblock/LC7/MglB family)
MSDLAEGLARLADRIGGARAALVIESSGIEVATWGRANFEAVAAECAELWKRAGSSETLIRDGIVETLEVRGAEGGWLLLSLGEEYVLALLAEPLVPPGKVRFYAKEWAIENREDFA